MGEAWEGLDQWVKRKSDGRSWSTRRSGARTAAAAAIASTGKRGGCDITNASNAPCATDHGKMTQGRRVQQNELVLFAGVGGCLIFIQE